MLVGGLLDEGWIFMFSWSCNDKDNFGSLLHCRSGDDDDDDDDVIGSMTM